MRSRNITPHSRARSIAVKCLHGMEESGVRLPRVHHIELDKVDHGTPNNNFWATSLMVKHFLYTEENRVRFLGRPLGKYSRYFNLKFEAEVAQW